MPGGEPYGALVGDYEFSNHPDDIGMLSKMSNVAAAAFCPFLTAASPKLFGFESFTELSKPRDLEKIFLSEDYIKWRSFRDTEDSRFVVLTMPRVLSRLPYGSETKPIDEFNYEEVELDAKSKRAKPVPHDHYAWMNAAFVMASRMTDAFSKTNWCTAIRGAENGGKVEDLPAHIFTSDDGDPDLKCPTEIGITDRRDAELSKLGFLALCHYKNTDYSVFFGGQSTQKPKKYDRPEATANAAISARLPYMMATGRIAHYLKVIARDKIGSFMERQDCEDWLNRWVSNYVCADTKPTAEMKKRYPLAAAKIEVQEIPGKPGAYNAVAWLRPWLQLEELNASLRMVASIPKKAGS
jgi:type VI secretion system protein ImpC